MCSRVMISKTAQLHTQTYKLISVYAPYFLSSLRTHPLSHPLFAFSFLLRSPSSLAQQQLVVCSNRLRSSPFSLSLCTVSLSSLQTRARHWCSADPPTCTCMICEWQVLKKKGSAPKCVQVCMRMFFWSIFLCGGACVRAERQCEDAWLAGVVVIGGVFGVLSLCCLPSPFSSDLVILWGQKASCWDVHLAWCKWWEPKELL